MADMPTMADALRIVRELAPHLFALSRDQVGIRLDCGTAGLGDGQEETPLIYAEPTVRMEDGRVLPVDALPGHYYCSPTFGGSGHTCEDALATMLYVLSLRAQERIAELARIAGQIPDLRQGPSTG